MEQESIVVFEAGTFPTPGAQLGAVEFPVMMANGLFNEFPIGPITIEEGEVFVVSFTFKDAPSGDSNEPTIVNDTDGCQSNSNGIGEPDGSGGTTWFDSCALKVSGDWLIRAKVVCGCSSNADCDDGVSCTNDTCDLATGECENIDNCSPGTCCESDGSCPDCATFFESFGPTMAPGSDAATALYGYLAGFETSGCTLHLEITDDTVTSGTVSFTPAPPTDIYSHYFLFGFSLWDTDVTGSGTLNGGTSVFFGGAVQSAHAQVALGFPVIASCDADGTWNLLLEDTAAGTTAWDDLTVGVSTGLISGTVTVDPSLAVDLCDDGNVCTDDTCDPADSSADPVGCVHTFNTASCTHEDACVPTASCVSGFCVGPRTTDCCEDVSDCNDFNDCTTDTCASNVCNYTDVGSPEACGSDVDDECTNPDTCDGAGNCDPNNEEDDTTCAGGTCTAGICDAEEYTTVALPEGLFPSSRPTGGACNEENQTYVIVGAGIDADGTEHAAVWQSYAGEPWELTPLPQLSEPTSIVHAIACTTAGAFCVAVGCVGAPDNEKAVYWEAAAGSDTWSATVAEAPPGSTGCALGVVYTPDAPSNSFASVGYIQVPGESNRAVVWQDYDDPPVFLPGPVAAPGLESSASTLVADGMFVRVGGFAEDAPGHRIPIVWQGGDPTYGFTPFPLPPGTAGGELNGLGLVGSSLHSGTVETLTGDEIGVVWECASDYSSCVPVSLPPLPTLVDFDNSQVNGGAPAALTVFGTSYLAGDDPLEAGNATRWTLDDTSGAVEVVARTDINYLVSSTMGEIHKVVPVADYTLCEGDIRFATVFTPEPLANRVSVTDSSAAGTGQTHAGVLSVNPPPAADVPTVSEWGLAVMALLVVTVGRLVLVRRRATSRFAG
jgi:hypothetical protein